MTKLFDIMKDGNKRYGKNTILPARQQPDTYYIDTGIFGLDYCFCGGIPEGLITLFTGWEGSGKTTYALITLGNILRKYEDKCALFVDAEGTFDPIWAEKLGVDLDRLVVARPESGEDCVDIIIAALEAVDNKMIILDSSSAMFTTVEIETSAHDAVMTQRARLIGRMLSASNRAMVQRRKQANPVTFLMISQYRSNIGGGKFADNKVITGGNQQRYQASCIVSFTAKEIWKASQKDIQYNDCKFTIQKVKGNKEFKAGEFKLIRATDLVSPEGSIDDSDVILSFMKKYSMIKGGGVSGYTVQGIDNKFKTHEDIRRYLVDPDNAMDCQDIKAKLIVMRRQSLGMDPLPDDGYLYRFMDDRVKENLPEVIEKVDESEFNVQENPGSEITDTESMDTESTDVESDNQE